jgi:Uma2 family endonuclease
MATVAKTARVTPDDHGRPMTLERFDASDFVPGFKYELIEGRVYVTYEPDLPEDSLATWLYHKVVLYSLRRPSVLNYVTSKARVFVPGRRLVTVPEPDLAGYRDFPIHQPIPQRRWQKVSPILVGEVPSPNDPHKDLIRNVQLYLLVPSIREYWLLDGRANAERPSLRVYRRRGNDWRILDFAYGETYTTSLLPGFKLVIDPRK